MMDLVRRRGDSINIAKLGNMIGCDVFEISALKNEGIKETVSKVVSVAKSGSVAHAPATFSATVEKAIKEIENNLGSSVDASLARWYAIKVFERDEKALETLSLTDAQKSAMEKIIEKCEAELDEK